MQARQLHSLFAEFNALCHRTRPPASANFLNPVLAVLSKNQDVTVGTLCKNIENAARIHQPVSSKPNPDTKAIIGECNALLEFLKVAQSKKVVVDNVEKLINLLEAHSYLSPLQFDELATQAPVSSGASQRTRSSKTRADVVSHYTEVLNASAEKFDHQSFDNVVERLSRDRRVRKQEIRAISESFLGYSPSSSAKKGEMIKMLSDRYNVNVRQKARAG